MTWVELTKVVTSGVLVADTTAPVAKPVPLTVNVSAALPAVTVAGEMLVIAGTTGAIVKVTALETGPDGLAKVICKDPGWASSVAGTTAVTCVIPTTTVLSGVLFADTTAPDRKPLPLTVNVKAALPAVTVDGEMPVMTGTGDAIVKVTALEAGPDGLARVICAEPG